MSIFVLAGWRQGVNFGKGNDQMSEADFQMILAEAERLMRECNTPEKAKAQLQQEGLLDENGEIAALYRSAQVAVR